jgi:hypothetical protein
VTQGAAPRARDKLGSLKPAQKRIDYMNLTNTARYIARPRLTLGRRVTTNQNSTGVSEFLGLKDLRKVSASQLLVRRRPSRRCASQATSNGSSPATCTPFVMISRAMPLARALHSVIILWANNSCRIGIDGANLLFRLMWPDDDKSPPGRGCTMARALI